MDILTHTLVGVVLARAVFARGEKGALAMTILASNLPDADGYGYFTSGVAYIQQYGGYGHALILAPLLALAAMLVVKFAMRARITLRGYAVCLAAVVIHILLDWTGVHGVRMFLPFSAHFYRLDLSDGVDPLILLVLLGALGAPLAIALFTSHLSSRTVAGPVRLWAWMGLLALLPYEGGRWMAHAHVRELLAAEIYKDQSPDHVRAFPLTLFEWRGLVEGDDFICEARVDIRFAYNPRTCEFEYPSRSSRAMEAADATPAFEAFEDFSEHPFWIVSPVDDDLKVELIDLRFGSPLRPGLEAVALVDRDGKVRNSGVGFGKRRWNISKSGLRFEF